MPNSKGREQGGGGGGCWRGKRTLRKGGSRSVTTALFTITEEEEGQRWRHDYKRKKRGMTGKNRCKVTGVKSGEHSYLHGLAVGALFKPCHCVSKGFNIWDRELFEQSLGSDRSRKFGKKRSKAVKY